MLVSENYDGKSSDVSRALSHCTGWGTYLPEAHVLSRAPCQCAYVWAENSRSSLEALFLAADRW